MWIDAYCLLGRIATPWLQRHQARRAALGKEDPARMGERFGISPGARPDGPLIWLHGASVGEGRAALLLIEALIARGTDCHFLLTTGTRSSADYLGPMLGPRVQHRYGPYDTPAAVEAFLAQWRPDLAIFLEQELWPCMLDALDRRGLPRILCNGRMSPASYRRWRPFSFAIRPLLRGFAAILAASEADATRFRRLGADANPVGNLKYAAPPPLAPATEIARMGALLGNRPRWLAASTHAEEEAAILDAHLALSAARPDILTLIAPRHAERGAGLAARCRALGIAVAQRSAGQAPPGEGGVYIADTMGEMGLWFRIAPIVFMGGSLCPAGGHNPAEPAALAGAILVGPGDFNFAEAYGELVSMGAALRVEDAGRLSARVLRLLADPQAVEAMGAAGQHWRGSRSGALQASLAHLAPWLQRIGAPIRDSAVPVG